MSTRFSGSLSGSARGWRRTAAALLGGTLLAATVGPAPAAQADTVYVPWSAYLPGWQVGYEPTSENDCVAGRDNCLKQTLKELNRIVERAGRSCSHDAVFSLAYLRITQTYGWSRDIPGYYEDVPFANHQDAVFARYYTDAYWSYHNGELSAVPEAWRIAFDAAKNRRVTGVGDLLLGMNAHINRDLPFVVAGVGLTAPDGSSRKRDYDQVEDFLARASKAMMAEAAARFDPTLDDADDGHGAAYTMIFQFISAARENAWRNAEALVSAPTPEARAVVAAKIEAEATAAARAILLAQSYLPPLTSTTKRDTFCAANHAAAAPLPYPFGTPKPYGL
jgi:hypothetical protein